MTNSNPKRPDSRGDRRKSTARRRSASKPTDAGSQNTSEKTGGREDSCSYDDDPDMPAFLGGGTG